jgi:hypothetical protein
MQFVSVGLLCKKLLCKGPDSEELYIPPPLFSAQFPLNVQLVSTGLLLWLNIPPPALAEFPLNVQLVTVGSLDLLYMPPPLSLAEFPLNAQ